jgi:hypothetical protein
MEEGWRLMKRPTAQLSLKGPLRGPLQKGTSDFKTCQGGSVAHPCTPGQQRGVEVHLPVGRANNDGGRTLKAVNLPQQHRKQAAACLQDCGAAGAQARSDQMFMGVLAPQAPRGGRA